jgi:hypothetical protein
MPICRFIFRLDFKANFDIIDSPGKILRFLSDLKKGDESFFPDLLEDGQKRLITGRYISKDKKKLYNFTVEPISIHSGMETVEGVDIEKLENNDILINLVKTTNKLRKEFHIADLVRCGFRMIFFDNIGDSVENVTLAIKKMLNNNFIQEFTSNVGNIEDIGIALDGTHEDETKFHFKCGPYYKDEAQKKQYLSLSASAIDKDQKFNFIADLDFYEENFSLAEAVSFQKWLQPVISRANNSISIIKSKIEDMIGD